MHTSERSFIPATMPVDLPHQNQKLFIIFSPVTTGMMRGEIWIGGPQVTQGYYINPKKGDPDGLAEKNKSDFVDSLDGMRWFKTGDVGQLTKKGTIQIIDRKKDLWKGPQGEYVSFGKVENIIKMGVPFIDQIMMYGRTGRAMWGAGVVPFIDQIMM